MIIILNVELLIIVKTKYQIFDMKLFVIISFFMQLGPHTRALVHPTTCTRLATSLFTQVAMSTTCVIHIIECVIHMIECLLYSSMYILRQSINRNEVSCIPQEDQFYLKCDYFNKFLILTERFVDVKLLQFFRAWLLECMRARTQQLAEEFEYKYSLKL